MYNKKTVTTHSTRSSQSATTTSRTQTTSTGYISQSRSSTTNRIASSNNSSSSTFATTSKYQPVYNQPRLLGTSESITRNAPVYRSLQYPKATQVGLTSAAERLASFGTNQEKKHSLPMINSEKALASSSPTWIPAPPPSSNTENNSFARDARPTARVIPAIAVPRPSNTSNVERYELKDDAFVLIFHHLFKTDDKLYRKGSEQDLKLIKKFFKRYRAKVADPCEDFTVKKVKKKMNEIQTKNFNNYSCIIVIIMSHGGTKDTIMANDEMYNFETEIVEPILMNSTLKDKPKLLVVQACKGDALMETDYHPRATNKMDMLKCYSTYEGTVSLRNVLTGTFFVQTLFEMIDENEDKEILDIMKLIRTKFANKGLQQSPTETSTLRKQFFFKDLKKY